MVFSITRRKTFAILALLLVCTIAAAVLECQVHASSSEDGQAADHTQAAPMSQPQHSSPHATGHVICLIAVLPTTMFFMWFTFVWLQASLRSVCLTSLAFAPFIPPRAAAH